MGSWVSKLWLLLCLYLTCTNTGIGGAQECGDNPMKQVLAVVKRTGRPLDNVLWMLRGIDQPAYSILESKFKTYAACVGLVDTGYFKKRSDSGPLSSTHPDHPTLQHLGAYLREHLHQVPRMRTHHNEVRFTEQLPAEETRAMTMQRREGAETSSRYSLPPLVFAQLNSYRNQPTSAEAEAAATAAAKNIMSKFLGQLESRLQHLVMSGDGGDQSNKEASRRKGLDDVYFGNAPTRSLLYKLILGRLTASRPNGSLNM